MTRCYPNPGPMPMGHKAMEEARELKGKVDQKIEDMRGGPVTK